MGPAPTEEVKIVIWDLDDTFWRGTLAEDGQVEPVARNIERVRQLAARGIVSSACSKNDEHAALAALSEMGVRDHFVFVAIGWSPKGAAVVSLLQRAGLRPANALFVDDHPSNRAEVASAAAGVRVLSPEDFSATDVSVWGAPDPQRTRLQQDHFGQEGGEGVARTEEEVEQLEFLGALAAAGRGDCAPLPQPHAHPIGARRRTKALRVEAAAEAAVPRFEPRQHRFGQAHAEDAAGEAKVQEPPPSQGCKSAEAVVAVLVGHVDRVRRVEASRLRIASPRRGGHVGDIALLP